MAKRQRSPPPPPSSPSVSSSSEEEEEGDDSPPSEISPVKKSSVGLATTMPSNHQVPSSDSSEGAEEVDDDGSENEEVSNEEDSSEDSGNVAVKANPSPLPQDSRNTNGGKTSLAISNSDSSTEDGEEVNSSSDSDQGTPPQTQAFASEEDNITSPMDRVRVVADDEDDGSEFSSSSDESANPRRSPSRNYTDAFAKQRDSKPLGSHVQTANSSPVRKRSAASLASVSEKKRRTDGRVGSEGDEKKDIFKRIWSNEDELALLQGILDYKERHHIVPSFLQQMESLLNSVKGSLSISASLNQMNDKIRRMKQKYMKAVKRIETAKNPNIWNAHDAAVFYLSRKIWGSRQEESVALNNIKPEKFKNFKLENGKGSHFSEGCPYLNEFVKSEHENMASVLSVSHIPMAKARAFNGKAKVLEMTQFQVHQKKHKLVGAALKLIKNALTEC